MANGMYTAPERVVRDGRVVCFKGEVMTAAEAERRGLVGQPAPKPAARPAARAPEGVDDPEAAAERLVKGNTADELKAMAAETGAEFPDGATKRVIAQAIVAAWSAKAVG